MIMLAIIRFCLSSIWWSVVYCYPSEILFVSGAFSPGANHVVTALTANNSFLIYLPKTLALMVR